jgi:hypothetical protein
MSDRPHQERQADRSLIIATAGEPPSFDGVWDSTRLCYREELCGGYLADAYSLLPLIKEIAHGPAEATYRPRAQT